MGWRIASILVLAACSGKGDEEPAEAVPTTDPVEDTAPTIPTGTRTELGEVKITKNGLGRMTIGLNEGERFHLSVNPESGWVGVNKLTSPSGEVVLDLEDWEGEDERISQALFPNSLPFGFNWPARVQDGPIDEAGFWEVEFVGDEGPRQVPVDVHISPEPALDELHIDIYYTLGIADQPQLREGLDGALAEWQATYNRIGITLVTYEVGLVEDVPNDMSFAFVGDPSITEAVQGKEVDHLVLIFSEFSGSNPSILGVAGAIPGPLTPSSRTFVTASWLSHAGFNGVMSPPEAELMGHTLAHEAGHFLGLFHPVECSDSDTCRSDYDALADTPDCVDDCKEQLGNNLMFPFTLCAGPFCDDQSQLTEEQGGVIRQHAAVR